MEKAAGSGSEQHHSFSLAHYQGRLVRVLSRPVTDLSVSATMTRRARLQAHPTPDLAARGPGSLVRSTDASTLGSVPHADGVIARLACARARTAGVDLPPILKKSNLTLEQINDSRVRLPARAQIRLLDLLADALQDDRLGFHLAEHADVRQMGLLYYVFASSSTVVEAVRRGTRYAVLVNEGVFQRCTVGRHIDIAISYVGIGRHVDRHQSECLMLLIVRLLRQLTGLPVSPRRVRFIHPRKECPGEFASYFGRDIEFGCVADEVRFDGSIASAPVLSADPYLSDLLERYHEEALSRRRPGHDSFRAMAEDAIVPLLPHAEVRIGEIARRLGVSERTLARRLSAEGLTFSDLLGQLRLHLAKRYLAEGDMSISQVAWLLGYQEVSAFSKAFKRWTGKTPRAMRASTMKRS
jgi:AraC-like DNA-binding protein